MKINVFRHDIDRKLFKRNCYQTDEFKIENICGINTFNQVVFICEEFVVFVISVLISAASNTK